MSDLNLEFEAQLADIARHVEEAEVNSTARAVVIAALTKAGADTAEVHDQLLAEMDTLTALRMRKWMLQGSIPIE